MADSLEEEPHREQIQEWLAAGLPVPDIERLLQERGVSAAEAARLVDHVFAKSVGVELDLSRRLTRAGLVRGTLWSLGGLAVLVGGIALFNSDGKVPGISLFAASAAAIIRGAIIIVKATT